MSRASLAMYRNLPPLAEATDALWAFLRDHLRDAGLRDVPERLDRDSPHDAAWLDPDLLLAQTCGYPYVRHLRGKVRLVATPRYGHPGCSGALTGSFVIVREEAAAVPISDFRGRTAVINDPGSNSGCNLLRALVAPLAEGGRFFGAVRRSGSHDASLAAVRSGWADVASVDCVTYGNIARFAPERLRGLVILLETPKGPGLPLITRAAAEDGELELLRGALAAAAVDLVLADVRDHLSLTGFDLIDDAGYEVLMRYANEAARRGYPEIA